MTNREKALELLDIVAGRECEGGGPSNAELLQRAIVLALADISEKLENLEVKRVQRSPRQPIWHELAI